MTTNSITRRGLLRTAGAVTLLVAAGGVWRAESQGVFSAGTGLAYEAWKEWRGDGERRSINLVKAAILASNAHNVQPWMFHVTDDAIIVYADPARNIGDMDPLRREMYISLGCALENLCIAGAACGYDVRLHTMPDATNAAHVADIELTTAQPLQSVLYQAIPKRHTNRAAFRTTRVLSSGTLDGLSTLQTSRATKLKWFSTPAQLSRISKMTVEATQAIVADAGMARSSAHWFRSDWAEIQKHRDGITTDAQGLTPLMSVLAKIAPALSEGQADEFWLSTTRDKQTATAGAYGAISVAAFPDKAHLLEAGRLWQRMHLAATTQGLAMQPLNQIVERADREMQLGLSAEFGAELQELVGDKPWRGVFLFRMGYPAQAAPASPRRLASQVLV